MLIRLGIKWKWKWYRQPRYHYVNCNINLAFSLFMVCTCLADSSFPHVLIKPQAIRDNPRPRPATSGKWQPQRELIKIQSNFPHHITTCMTHIYQKFMCKNRQKFKRNEGNKSKLNTFLIMPRQRVEARERDKGKGGGKRGVGVG